MSPNRLHLGRVLSAALPAAVAIVLIVGQRSTPPAMAQTDPTPTPYVGTAEPTASPDYHATATTGAYILATTVAQRDTARRHHEAAYNEAWRLARELYAMQTACPNVRPLATPLPFALALPYTIVER